jgi:hypothetical protein
LQRPDTLLAQSHKHSGLPNVQRNLNLGRLESQTMITPMPELIQFLRDNACGGSNYNQMMIAAADTLAAIAAASTVPPPLIKAAQDVLDRWNSPKWEWAKQGPTGDLMFALRDALAAARNQAVQPTCYKKLST